MQEAQQLFNEKIANGTMTKEELENTPTCLRHFDEAEDAILNADQNDFQLQSFKPRSHEEIYGDKVPPMSRQEKMEIWERFWAEKGLKFSSHDLIFEKNWGDMAMDEDEESEVSDDEDDLIIQADVRSVLDSVVNQVIDYEEDYDGWDARELRTNKWNKIESEWQTHTTPREYYEVIEGYPYLPEGYVEKPKAKSKWADYEKLLKPPEDLKRHDEEENNNSWCTLM